MTVTRRNYSNSASVGVINDVLNNTDTTTAFTLQTGLTSWPATPCTAAINIGQADEEVVLVTAISGVSVTVTRGYNGSSTRAHTSNATLTHASIAQDFDEANAHHVANSGVHGVTGAVVGTSDAQTLTNKTLTEPTISGFTHANHDHSVPDQGGLIPQTSVTGLPSALGGKANDNAVVHLTGDETAAGNKTFTGNFSVGGNRTVAGNDTVTGNQTVSGASTLVNVACTTLSASSQVSRNGHVVWAPDNLSANTFSGTTDSSGFLVVTHGLGWTPTKVFVQLTSPSSGSNQGFPIVTAISSTTFTIRMATTLGSTLNLGIAGFWLALA